MNANDRHFEAELEAINEDQRQQVAVSKDATTSLASAMTAREAARRT